MTETHRTASAFPSRPWAGHRAWLPLVIVALLAGCASTDHRAPVEDRSGSVRPVTQPALPPGASTTAPGAAAASAGSTPAVTPATIGAPLPPGSENAGKPGYYTVKPGDTLIRIGLETGQNWRDIARWNGLENPNVIEVGQVVRVAPLPAPTPVAEARPVASAASADNRPLAAGSAPAPAASPSASAPGTSTPAGAAASGPAANAALPAAPVTSPPVPAGPEGDENVVWAWPATGSQVAGFDEVRNKGLTLAGQPGDPVFAAADGRVVYAGSGLRGYGNLVIVKHNNLFLSAYAHNQALLVKEDQVVRRGQKIAEMGSTEADRVQLHFEIRRQGRPIDPARLLPAR